MHDKIKIQNVRRQIKRNCKECQQSREKSREEGVETAKCDITYASKAYSTGFDE